MEWSKTSSCEQRQAVLVRNWKYCIGSDENVRERGYEKERRCIKRNDLDADKHCSLYEYVERVRSRGLGDVSIIEEKIRVTTGITERFSCIEEKRRGSEAYEKKDEESKIDHHDLFHVRRPLFYMIDTCRVEV